MLRRPPTPTPFPYTTLFRSRRGAVEPRDHKHAYTVARRLCGCNAQGPPDVSDAQGEYEPLRQDRSEEHTSELQSPCNLVCRLLLEKKNRKKIVERKTRRRRN